MTTSLNDEWWPTWSPDGTEVAYAAGSEGTIDVIGIDGSGYRRLTHSGSDAFPAWSNTDRIAFVRRGDVWTMSKTGTDIERITKTPFPEFGPSWSPNGEHLVWPSERPVSESS